jgi:hypothetical protein
MAKLEEITEILVAEINQFELAVKRLEQIQQQKISIDSNKLEYTIKQQQENMEKAFLYHKHAMISLGHSLEKAKAYPIWALIIFTASLILNGILIYVISSNEI